VHILLLILLHMIVLPSFSSIPLSVFCVYTQNLSESYYESILKAGYE